LLRLGAAISLLYNGGAGVSATFDLPLHFAFRLIEMAGGALLLVGMWTPAVGIVVAADEVWRTLAPDVSHPAVPLLSILLAVVAASIAMLGPGAWSIDARLFGRRRFEIEGQVRRNY